MSSPPVLSTLRLQFHRGFTFADAEQHVDYFAALGISHLYASPITTAQPGSTHGYDTVDYTRVNPELGGEAGLKQLVAALRARSMGLIIDIVPNHMGVGGAENAWWLDILEWGRHAAHARYFDIDWHSPDPALRGKVLAPFLGESFGDAISESKIALRFDPYDGRFFVAYYDHRFPICPADYPRILAQSKDPEWRAQAALFEGIAHQTDDQERASTARAALLTFAQQRAAGALAQGSPHRQRSSNHAGNSRPDNAHDNHHDSDPNTAIYRDTSYTIAQDRGLASALAAFSAQTHVGQEALLRLLDRQHYRLAWWRTAADEINWRRFFDISTLAGMRVERSEVFDATHELIFSLYAKGLIDGVRIDHVDGLAEPREYCQRLRTRLSQMHAQRPPALREHEAYIVVEKILARGETMRSDWRIDGTTGYDFMNDVGALLHDPAGAAPLAHVWSNISGRSASFADEALPARRKILAENLGAELDRASRALHRIARDANNTRDFAFGAIRRVLTELVVHFPVYRIYPFETLRSATDEQYFAMARDGARRTLTRADHPLLEKIDAWLGGMQQTAVTETSRDPRATLYRIAQTLFSQLTSPVAAKSVEDTACYRYGRLISRNEVGADPDDFALSPQAFHAINEARRQTFPHAMLTTATHDHKRGEDVRARLAVLSELPEQWASTLRRWSALNSPQAALAPSPGFESMLYQTLVACWPLTLSPDDREGVAALAERVAAWQEKAQREAKLDSDWFAPNTDYENACRAFVSDILSPPRRQGFLASLAGFVSAIAPAGAINSLQQTLLRLTAPGLPDLYQGTELWDFSLVDPDNRRPVDYALRARLLASIDCLPAHAEIAQAMPTNGDAVVQSEGDGPGTLPAARLLDVWQDGRIKQAVIHRALLLRRQAPALFLEGSYLPIDIVGKHARSVLAFARHHHNEWAIVVVTRLAARLLGADQAIDRLSDTSVGEADTDAATSARAEDGRDAVAIPWVAVDLWEDTALRLPQAIDAPFLIDCLAPGRAPHQIATAGDDHATFLLPVAAILRHLPVALLTTVGSEVDGASAH